MRGGSSLAVRADRREEGGLGLLSFVRAKEVVSLSGLLKMG